MGSLNISLHIVRKEVALGRLARNQLWREERGGDQEQSPEGRLYRDQTIEIPEIIIWVYVQKGQIEATAERNTLKTQRRQSGLKSEGSWTWVKKFWFSRKISEKFRFFQAIPQKKSIFQGNFPKNVRFSQVILQKISTFQVKFPKNFDFFRQFPKIYRFSREISEKFRFFKAISQKIIDFQCTFKKNFDF